jgi:asparagine synthase (glutamine-hydrolysing)
VDESHFAELVARASHLEMVYRSPEVSPLVEKLLPVLRAQGEPFAGSSVAAQHAVMAAVHDKGLKVVLDGQGADELLGGYVPYLGFRSAGLVRPGGIASLPGELAAQVRSHTVTARGAISGLARGLLSPDFVERLRGSSGGRLGVPVAGELAAAATLAEAHIERGTVLARRLWQDVTSESLPALLRYEDRNSMAFGIESRTPFLDYRLVELTAAMPDRLKIRRGTTKWALRRAMRDRLPREVLERRDKVGFATPQASWLIDARPELKRLLEGGEIVRRGWLTGATVDGLLDRLSTDRQRHEQVWRAVVLEAWLRLTWPSAADRDLGLAA